jgi:hypothetical protein
VGCSFGHRTQRIRKRIYVTRKRRVMMIKLMNKKNHPRCVYDVECFRPYTLGNPFKMQGESDRDYVIGRFRDYARSQLEKSKTFRAAIQVIAERHARGEEVHLVCWCYPKPCHTHVIRELAEETAWQLLSKKEPISRRL